MNKPPIPIGIPYSEEVEAATIGAVLTNPEQFLLLADKLHADDFFIKRHRYIWRAIERLAEREQLDFDMLIVSEELKAVGYLDEVGGMPALIRLVNQTPSSMNAIAYASLVLAASARRQLLQFTDEAKTLVFDEELTVEQVMELAQTKLQGLVSKTIPDTEMSIKEVMSGVIDDVERRTNGGQDFYLPTGYKVIDQFCSGLERSCVHVIAGKPGMGKSSLCLGISLGAARHGVRVMFISNEMSAQRLGMRLAAMETGINLQSLKRGEMTDQEMSRFFEAMERLSSLPMTLDYLPQTTAAQVHAKILRAQRQHGVDVVIVDGLWRMQAPDCPFGDNRNTINGHITDNLARIAKETNVAMILTHQLTKKVDDRGDKRPTKGDLEYGGQIDQNADVIMLIYRDEVYNEASEWPGMAEIIFDKNRDAPTGTVALKFDKKTTCFEDAQTMDLQPRPQLHEIMINGKKTDHPF